MEHGVRREPQSSSIPTARFNLGIPTLSPLYYTEGTHSRDGLMDYPRCSGHGNASWKVPRLIGFSKLGSQLQD